jgi:hypothetical protein
LPYNGATAVPPTRPAQGQCSHNSRWGEREGYNANALRGRSQPRFEHAVIWRAFSSGSVVRISGDGQLLLDHWNWEDHAQLTGFRVFNAIKAAAAVAADHGRVLAKLLDHKDRIAKSAYDNAIVRIVKCSQTASMDRLLALRHADPTLKAKAEFWLRCM